MIFKTDLPPQGVSLENSGDNYGVEAGSNSGVIVVNQGLGYDNTKALCLDIVRDELEKYKAEALVEARKRNDELFEKVIEKLDNQRMTDEQALTEFKNPAMQYDYAEAQKAYIKAGTPELASVLSDILVRRVGEPSRTLLQIALGEAIQVAPKLIKSQMASLALAFMLRHTVKLGIRNQNQFVAYLENTILPLFNSGVSQKESEFQHLNFTGCSQYTIANIGLASLLSSSYSGLFMKGFEKDKIPADSEGKSFLDLYPALFCPCLNAPELWQINSTSKDALFKLMKQLDVSQDHCQIVSKTFETNLMSDAETEQLTVRLVPGMEPVFDYWKESDISHQSLTSVGIIIGAQYSHLITGENYDLNIWI